MELISEFIKFAYYKISIQKLTVFLYTNNEMLEKFKESILFTILSKTVKYLGINLTQDVNDLKNEIYKTLLKEIKGGAQKNGQTLYVHGLKEFTL